jgi:TonB family protein
MLNESILFALWTEIAVKSTLVLAIAWLITLVLRRQSAALRHLVWTAASVAVLALPFFSLWLPSFEIPSVRSFAPAAAALFETAAKPPLDAAARSLTPPSSLTAPARPTPNRLRWRFLLLSLWAAGVAAALTRMSIAFRAMSSLRGRANVSADPELPIRLSRELGISRAVDVLETSEGCMPMTWGILRPTIFMPCDAGNWTEERRTMVLLHELAHVRRADVATHLAARLALVLNWWNPIAWIAWREFLKERERATDDMVLNSGARASDYAGHLLEVARGMQSEPALAWGALAMARRSQLEFRLAAILDPRVNRKSPGRAAAFAIALLAVAMAAPFAALRAQDQQSQPSLADIDATIRAAQAQKNYRMLVKAAEAFESLRQYDNAGKLLDAALAIGGADAQGELLVKLADLEEKRGHPKQAEPLYARAAQLIGDRPEAAPALIQLGVMSLGQKNYQQAVDYFQKAQNLDPAQAGRAQMWMALVREREQNPTEAEALYKSALAVDAPNSRDALTTKELYARFLQDQGRGEEAGALSASVLELRTAEAKQQATSSALHIGPGMSPPKLLSKVEPEYSEEGRVAKYQGTVALYVDIDVDGVPRNIRIARSLGFALDENAVAAVQQWRFQPAVKDGAPITVQASIEVNFRLL